MLKNFWYIGCASSQLKSDPVAIQILDKKVVLFRDSSGKPQALLDRCCHRGFPLSRGKVNDGNIACGYHGWEYKGTGQCVKIPSQNSDKPIPKSHCVQSFSCTEKDEFVWVWVGEDMETEVPSAPEVSAGRWLQGSRIINCNFVRALEITYDGAEDRKYNRSFSRGLAGCKPRSIRIYATTPTSAGSDRLPGAGLRAEAGSLGAQGRNCFGWKRHPVISINFDCRSKWAFA